nr:uncharacterized protein LOC109618915 [Crassostrea gigas]
MKVFIIAIAVGGFLLLTHGQCPLNAENSLVTSCEGLTKYGSFLYVDFYQINRPCTCIVTTMFVGELLVISLEVDVPVCNTQIVIDKSVIMGCPLQHLTSQTLDVQMNQSVDVRAEYKLPSTPGTFYQCIGFRQNAGLNGNLSVVCGFPLNAVSTTTKTTITTTLTTSSWLSRQSSIVSEPISSLIHDDVNVTETTSISKECICGHKDDVSGESLLSLQIPLAVFVVISIVSTIMNIYFYIQIKLRENSGSKTSNIIKNLRSGAETTAETYTELGNTVSENQYDSLSGKDNYINIYV